MSYASGEKKSSKLRYIRVAAIVIVIIQGRVKICVAVSHKKTGNSAKQTRTYHAEWF